MGFSTSAPSFQASIDIFKDGWLSSFPPAYGLTGGHLDHFNDGRVPWVAQYFDFPGKDVLELGPLEAYNTFQFEKSGASVTSIEGSVDNFLKCLIVKNAFDLKAKFLHGDFMKFSPKKNYDIVWASGVLYHLVDPIGFLERISSWSDKLFIWTHYYDESIIKPGHDGFAHFDEEKNETLNYLGNDLTLFHRSYLDPNMSGTFSGGPEHFSYWLRLEDIKLVLAGLGFKNITMGVNNPLHPSGPACFFLASR